MDTLGITNDVLIGYRCPHFMHMGIVLLCILQIYLTGTLDSVLIKDYRGCSLSNNCHKTTIKIVLVFLIIMIVANLFFSEEA